LICCCVTRCGLRRCRYALCTLPVACVWCYVVTLRCCHTLRGCCCVAVTLVLILRCVFAICYVYVCCVVTCVTTLRSAFACRCCSLFVARSFYVTLVPHVTLLLLIVTVAFVARAYVYVAFTPPHVTFGCVYVVILHVTFCYAFARLLPRLYVVLRFVVVRLHLPLLRYLDPVHVLRCPLRLRYGYARCYVFALPLLYVVLRFTLRLTLLCVPIVLRDVYYRLRCYVCGSFYVAFALRCPRTFCVCCYTGYRTVRSLVRLPLYVCLNVCRCYVDRCACCVAVRLLYTFYV